VIGAIAAFGLATSPLAGNVDLDTRVALALQACKPKSEADALKCMDRALPKDARRAIVSRNQPEFKAYAGDSSLIDGVVYGFGLDSRQSILVDEYRHAGLPVDGVFAPAEYVLESYWLRARGCRYEKAERIAMARKHSDEVIATAQDEAEFMKNNPDGVYDWWLSMPRLNVNCERWQETRR
jgi:hypothetical protein